MSSITQWIAERGQLKLLVLGLILILISQTFSIEFLKVKIDAMLANLGALLVFVGVLQWLFDQNARESLIRDVIISINGNAAIRECGVIDCTSNSKQISDCDAWRSAQSLIIGQHYASRFIEDFSDVIQNRIAAGLETIILHINPNSIGAHYLQESGSGLSGIESGVSKLLRLKEEAFGSSEYVKLVGINRVLRYTFIYTNMDVWVRFITSSDGHVSAVPAIKVRTGTPLFSFFHDDIQRLLK